MPPFYKEPDDLDPGFQRQWSIVGRQEAYKRRDLARNQIPRYNERQVPIKIVPAVRTPRPQGPYSPSADELRNIVEKVRKEKQANG